ncbi:MAG: helix-turn-helix transcriptional regulator [Lachnospiraceae bacterium]|nr:helix-turn-helix transcriptional regulator [Lachnospiraceae bacterium]
MNPFYEKREMKLQTDVSENLSFPEHLHEDTELLLVRQGQIEVNVMGERRCLSAGDCAVIFPQQIHSYYSAAENRVQILVFDASLSGTYMRTLQKLRPICPFITSERLNSDVRLAFDRMLALSDRSVAEQLQAERLQDTFKSEEEINALRCAWIQVILALLMPALQLEEQKKAESMDVTCRLVQYVMEHFKEPLTLEFLAKQLHVNKYYLSHIFSDRLQMNFRQYLNRIRLEHALHDMQTTDHSITRIWEDAGFNSQRSFNRIFLETMGISPMEYRRRKATLLFSHNVI